MRGRSKRVVLSVAISATLVAVVVPVPAVAQDAPPPSEAPAPDVSGMEAAAGGPLRTSVHPVTGVLRFMGTHPGQAVRRSRGVTANSRPADAARAFLGDHGSAFGVEDPGAQLRELDTEARRGQGRGRGASVRFQQAVGDVPVLAGELSVQLDEANQVLSATGEILPDLDVDLTADVDGPAAAATAVRAVEKYRGVPADDLTATPAELWVYHPGLLGAPGPQDPRLVHRVSVTSAVEPMNELVLVDADTGAVVLHFDELPHGKERYVCDNANSHTQPQECTSARDVRSEGSGVTGTADVDDVFDYTGDTYDYLLSMFGRDSLDDAGMPLYSTVRYCEAPGPDCPYFNAYWDGSQATYGEGVGSDDVVAHELAHGLTEFTADLFYYYQSGAINESMSDVFGELIDQGNGAGNDDPAVRWELGEDSSLGTIRDMADPTTHGHPDRVQSPYWYAAAEEPGEGDNGGVHVNSGVNNKAASLLTDGGSFNGHTVAPLGATKVAHVYYEVLTTLLTSGSDYADLATALPQACTNLIGTAGITSADCDEVQDAVDATQMDLSPLSAAPAEAPVCDGSEVPTDLFFDGFETAPHSRWSGLGSSMPWDWSYGYARTGTNTIWGFNPDTTSDGSTQLVNEVTIPASSEAYLHFAHSYSFEFDGARAYDGGVVEYSTDGGSGWTDAKLLFTHGGYDTTLNSEFNTTNPLAGRDAFGGTSFGYSASRVDLSSLAGQDVTLRWRVGTDELIGALGWFVDDVRMYTCEAAPETPTLLVHPETGLIHGRDWPEGTSVTVTVDDPETPTSPDFMDASATATPNRAWTVDATAVGLAPGHVVTAQGGGLQVTHTVTPAKAVFAQYDSDNVHGVATPGATVELEVDPIGDPPVVLTGTAGPANDPNGLGEWTIYVSSGLAPKDVVVVREYDAGGSATVDYLQQPTITVDRDTNTISGVNWDTGNVSVIVDADGTGEFEDNMDVPVTDGTFSYTSPYDIAAGDLVEVSSVLGGMNNVGSFTRHHFVEEIQVTEVDTAADTVSGTGGDDGEVVRVHAAADPESQTYHRDVAVATDGTWTADFSTIAGSSIELDAFDITDTSEVWVLDFDEGLNATRTAELPVTCATDPDEPGNDEVAGAVELVSGEEVQGEICPDGDVDYYSIDAAAGETVVATLTWDDQGGTVPMTIQLLDADGETVLDEVVDSTSGAESISWVTSVVGAYFARVASNSGPSPYRLSVATVRLERFEETDAAFGFSSGWVVESGSKYSGGSVRTTRTAGEAVEVYVTGPVVRVVALTGPNRGTARVWVDGVDHGIVDTYSPVWRFQQVVFEASGIGEGEHLVRVEHVDGGLTVDAVEAEGVVAVARFEETDAAFGFSSGWVVESGSKYSGGSVRTTRTAGEAVEVYVTGPVVRVVALTGPNRGTARVWVDGVDHGIVDTYSPVWRFQQVVFEASGIGEGEHLVRVEHVDGGLTVDAVEAEGVVAVARFEETDAAFGFSSGWVVESGSKYSGGSVRTTRTAGEAVEVYVTGPVVRVVALTGPNRGTARVWVDGVDHGIVDTYSPVWRFQQVVFEASGIGEGEHLVRVEHVDGGLTVDAVEAEGVVAVARFEETDAAFGFSSGWVVESGSKYSGGSVRTTRTAGEAVEVYVTGPVVRVVALTGPNRGTARVWVDGVDHGIVDTYSPVWRFQQVVFVASGIGEGEHLVRVEHVDGGLTVDAVEAEGVAIP